MRIIQLLSAITLLFLKPTFGAEIHYPELKFSKISYNEGLSNNNVECILKDSDGFIWFGTRNGLCRFDGYDIKTFYKTDKRNSLSGNRIQCLEEDKDGNLWIGTYNNGLNKYDKKTGVFTHYSEHSIGEQINKIRLLSDGSLWIGSNHGLARYLVQQDSFKIYLPEKGNSKSLNAIVVYDIFESKNKKVYIATEYKNIQQFDAASNSFTSIEYKRDPNLNTEFKKQIIEDNKGVLWISANVHGLCSYDPATGSSEIFTMNNSGLSTNILRGNMMLDPSGNIWICSDGGGINIINPTTKQFSYIYKEEKEGGLSSDHIYSAYMDNLGIIWIGTFDEGINYYDPARFKFSPSLFSPNDLSFFKKKSVLGIFQDSKQRIWIGTDGYGLFMLNKAGEITEYHHNLQNSNSLSTEVITSINEDRYGNILLGTYAGGFMSLNLEENKIERFIQGEDASSPGSVWSILRDSKERIWLGMLGTGANLYNPNDKTFVNLGPSSNNPNKIDYPNIMAIIEDSDGDIWFGTEGKGIFILDNETNKVLRPVSDRTYSVGTQGIIKCIYEDKWGQFWIGTEGSGLFKFNKKTSELVHLSETEGLPSNIIQSIIEDSHGNLWMGTSKGLAVLNPNINNFSVYLESDGLSGNEFNQNALIQLQNGLLVCGTSKGLDAYNPESIGLNQILPRVVLTKLKVLNQEIFPSSIINGREILKQSISYTHQITLTAKEKVFSIEFAALNYTLPKKCSYAYKLEGFDGEWNFTSANRRMANYTNLPAGYYTFKVKASNNDGKWGNNITELGILILPPFYKTWWFKIILIVLGFILIYSIYRYRLNIYKSNYLKKQYEQDKKIMHLENEKLESELQKLTFHVLNRNRDLIDQKNRLLGLSMKAKESVRIGLQDIISKFDEELNDDKDWKYMEPQLDKVYNNFVTKLKEQHQDLSISEIKIAAYVRMNLSTKEISEFMHKTTRAIENDRYRLRKKIGLDTNDSLKSYLNNL